MKYRIGQILTSKVETELKLALSEDTVVVPKGNKVIVGADKFAHHIRTGRIQPFPEGAEIEGYDGNGIAEYIYIYSRNHFPIDEMLEDYDDTKERFIEEIEYALDEIGF